MLRGKSLKELGGYDLLLLAESDTCEHTGENRGGGQGQNAELLHLRLLRRDPEGIRAACRERQPRDPQVMIFFNAKR